MKYVAEIRTRRGKLKHRTAEYETREQAAAAAFRAIDWARDCSTCYGAGMDIRWHRRDQIAGAVNPDFVDVDRAYEDQCADICGR